MSTPTKKSRSRPCRGTVPLGSERPPPRPCLSTLKARPEHLNMSSVIHTKPLPTAWPTSVLHEEMLPHAQQHEGDDQAKGQLRVLWSHPEVLCEIRHGNNGHGRSRDQLREGSRHQQRQDRSPLCCSETPSMRAKMLMTTQYRDRMTS